MNRLVDRKASSLPKFRLNKGRLMLLYRRSTDPLDQDKTCVSKHTTIMRMAISLIVIDLFIDILSEAQRPRNQHKTKVEMKDYVKKWQRLVKSQHHRSRNSLKLS